MFEVINSLAGNWFFDSLFILITHISIFFMIFEVLWLRDRLLFVKSVVGYMFVYFIDLVINLFYLSAPALMIH